MAYTYSAWLPCARKHELTEQLRSLRAAVAGKSYTAKPYVHVKGKIIATMQSDKLAALKAEIVELRAVVVELRAPCPVVSIDDARTEALLSEAEETFARLAG